MTLEAETDDTLRTTKWKSLFNTLLYNIRKKGKGSPQIRQYIADKLQSLMTGDKNVWLLNKFLDELRTMTAKARRIFGEVLDYTTGATDSSTTEGDRDPRVGKKDKRDKKKKETKRDKTKGDSPKNQKSPIISLVKMYDIVTVIDMNQINVHLLIIRILLKVVLGQEWVRQELLVELAFYGIFAE